MHPLREGETMSIQEDRERIEQITFKKADGADVHWLLSRLSKALDVVESAKKMLTDDPFEGINAVQDCFQKAEKYDEEDSK